MNLIVRYLSVDEGETEAAWRSVIPDVYVRKAQPQTVAAAQVLKKAQWLTKGRVAASSALANHEIFICSRDCALAHFPTRREVSFFMGTGGSATIGRLDSVKVDLGRVGTGTSGWRIAPRSLQGENACHMLAAPSARVRARVRAKVRA